MNDNLTVIDRGSKVGPVEHGRQKFAQELLKCSISMNSVNYWTQKEDDFYIVIGLLQDKFVRILTDDAAETKSIRNEGVYIHQCEFEDKKVLVISGTDDKGLMYALLEMADRVHHYGMNAFKGTINIEEYPDNKVRGMDRYIMGHLDNEWFLSDEFWQYYLDRLADYRFNRFTLIVGFDTAYLSPPYPFFVKVPGFLNVKVKGMDEAEQLRNLNQLRCIGRLCKERGLEFHLATWQQTPWTEEQSVIVEGLFREEGMLADYCAEGLKTLINECPEIDGIQLRVNAEAGVGTFSASLDDFWKICITAAAAADHPVKIAVRAKGLSDDVIQHALETGLDVEVPTKYWCEHTGLPYHLSRMRTEELNNIHNLNSSRRYSYADLLQKPYWYDVVYRLWNYGSTCLFAWGDPDYVRRFAYSCRLGGIGFTVDSALSLKGGHEMLHKEPWNIYKNPALQGDCWEDERYWFRYLLYGRIGYSVQTDMDVWQRELREHFGDEGAGLMERCYGTASKILPLITAFHMPAHPSMHYWPEMNTGAALFAEHNYNKFFGEFSYGSSKPSDEGLFYSIEDYVKDFVDGKLKGKYTPLQVRNWFIDYAKALRGLICAADKDSLLPDCREYKQLNLDFLMLADLAEYHAQKIMAAVELDFYRYTDHVKHLQKAYDYMVSAHRFWQALSDKGNHYNDNLIFCAGSGEERLGHWRQRLPELEKDLERLGVMLENVGELEVEDSKEQKEYSVNNCVDSLRSFKVDWPETWPAGVDLEMTVKVGGTGGFKNGLMMNYRHTDQTEGSFKEVPMKEIDGGYRATIPGEYLSSKWDIMVYFSTVENGSAVIYPGLNNSQYPLPYHIIRIRNS